MSTLIYTTRISLVGLSFVFMIVNFVVHLDYKAVYMRVYFPFSLSIDIKGKMLNIYDLTPVVLLIDTFLCHANAGTVGSYSMDHRLQLIQIGNAISLIMYCVDNSTF